MFRLCAITFIRSLDMLVTGSWDRTVRFWDPRTTSQQSSHNVPERVYLMDLVNNTLVVAMASRLFHIYDIRKMDEPAQIRDSSLKFMTRALACMADGQGTHFSSRFGEVLSLTREQVTRRLPWRAVLPWNTSIQVLKYRRRSTLSSAIARPSTT